jgi:uncharacterized protein (TIGR02302 family)
MAHWRNWIGQNDRRHRPEATVSIRRAVALARVSLFWERLWPALAPALGVCGVFAAAALFDAFALLSPAWHGFGLLLFALALGVALWRGLAGLGFPDRAQGLRRLERDSGLAHRPLTALEDRLSLKPADAAVERLWHAHLKRMRGSLNKLRLKPPEAGLSRHDPWAIRALIALPVIIGLVIAGGDAPTRLQKAFAPALAWPTAPIKLDAWIAPPAYTGLAPIVLARGPAASRREEPIAVPQGSVMLARLNGGRTPPSLILAGEAIPFASGGKDDYQISRPIDRDARVTIRQGGRVYGDWRIEVVADRVPEMALAAPPETTARASLAIALSARDDYGVTRLWAEFRRPGLGSSGAEPTLDLDLPLADAGARVIDDKVFLDLTAHKWAGLEVELQIAGEDALGQIGRSEPVASTLPARTFLHPIAKTLIEHRQKLGTDPGHREPAREALLALGENPEPFAGDVVVALALSVAAARLAYDPSAPGLASVQDLLWQTALRIEEGTAGLAAGDLKSAEEALREALARKASTAEIAQLLQNLQEAWQRFLNELTAQAIARAQREGPLDALPGNWMAAEDLRDLLAHLRDLALSGSLEAARELLQALREIRENLNEARLARQTIEAAAAARAWPELGHLMRRQQELFDRNFNRSSRGAKPNALSKDALEQERLRGRLGQIVPGLGLQGDIPQAFARADRAMRRASQALNQGRAEAAIQPQSEALEALRQGVAALQQRLNADAFSKARDPLGRLSGKAFDEGFSTKVPDAADMQRARMILEELFRRLGEKRRPKDELEYLERLLKRF